MHNVCCTLIFGHMRETSAGWERTVICNTCAKCAWYVCRLHPCCMYDLHTFCLYVAAFIPPLGMHATCKKLCLCIYPATIGNTVLFCVLSSTHATCMHKTLKAVAHTAMVTCVPDVSKLHTCILMYVVCVCGMCTIQFHILATCAWYKQSA